METASISHSEETSNLSTQKSDELIELIKRKSANESVPVSERGGGGEVEDGIGIIQSFKFFLSGKTSSYRKRSKLVPFFAIFKTRESQLYMP